MCSETVAKTTVAEEVQILPYCFYINHLGLRCRSRLCAFLNFIGSVVEVLAVPFVLLACGSDLGLVLCLDSELGYLPLGDSQAMHLWVGVSP